MINFAHTQPGIARYSSSITARTSAAVGEWGLLGSRLIESLRMHGSREKPAHYKFRIFTDGEQHEETDPLAFDDTEEVWHEGAMSSCEIIRSMHGRIESDLDWRLDVADNTGKIIYRFSFKAERL